MIKYVALWVLNEMNLFLLENAPAESTSDGQEPDAKGKFPPKKNVDSLRKVGEYFFSYFHDAQSHTRNRTLPRDAIS